MELDVLINTVRMTDANWQTRKSAVKLLSGISDSVVISYLLEALTDDNSAVKLEAVRGIKKAISRAVFNLGIISALNVCLLGNLGDKRIESAVLDCFEIVISVEGVGYCEEMRANIERLALQSEHPRIRQNAVKMLDTFDIQGLGLICAVLDDKDQGVIKEALLAVNGIFRSYNFQLECIPFRTLLSLNNSIEDLLLQQGLSDALREEADYIQRMIDLDTILGTLVDEF